MQTSIPVVPQRLRTLRGLGTQTYLGRSAKGTRLQHFDLLRHMGGGGMAEVLLARPVEASNELVVLKLLRRELLDGDMYKNMFLDEIQVTTRLHHPNLVRIAEPGYSLVDWFLVLQPVPGLSLSRFLRRLTEMAAEGHPLSLKATAFIVAQVASGLAYVNAIRDDYGNPMNVVHRDVSPKNIMLTRGGQVKLIDFGLTHLEGRAGFTRSGEVKGKLGYISPEQLSRAEPVTHQSDIFSLGIVLWEMLTGRRLFLRRSYAESLAALAEGQVGRPGALRKMPALLDEIVMQALRRSPHDRFRDAGLMAAALMDYVGADRGNVETELVRKVRLIRAAHPTDVPTDLAAEDYDAAIPSDAPSARAAPLLADREALITTRVRALFKPTPNPAAAPADLPRPRRGLARLSFHLTNGRLRRQLRRASSSIRARHMLQMSVMVVLAFAGGRLLHTLAPATPMPGTAPTPARDVAERPRQVPARVPPPLVIETLPIAPDAEAISPAVAPSPRRANAHSPRRRHHPKKK